MSKARDKANSTVSNFASTGIDDNADANAITIDSSENVLVGTTNTDPAFNNVAGQSMAASGQFQVTRDGGIPALINRKSDFGTILDLRKDGTTVGSIGTLSSRLHILNGDTGLRIAGDLDQIFPCGSGGSDRDAAIDLGSTGVRFKDLYLSGGAYLGGTGSSNLLNDYEEGTWTPTYGGSSSNPSVTTDIQYGHYTKIGNIVIATFGIGTDAASGGSGSLLVNGLPFSSKSGADHLSGPALAYSFNQTISDMVMGISANDTKIILYSNNNSASTFATGALIDGANKNRLQGTVIYAVS